jgi:hypothetical protein
MMQMRSGIGWLSKNFCVAGHPFIFNPSAADSLALPINDSVLPLSSLHRGADMCDYTPRIGIPLI